MKYNKRSGWGVLWAAAILGGCAFPGTPEDPDLPKRQQGLFERGVREYNQQKYEEALALWKQAYGMGSGTEWGTKSKTRIEETEKILLRLKEYERLPTGKPKKS